MTNPNSVNPTTALVAPAEYWRQAVAAITSTARTILRDVEEAKRIYRGNRLDQVIAALGAGEAVPGTTMGKEQAQAWAAMIDAVAGFMATEIQTGFTIEDGLYALWPVVGPSPGGGS